MTKPTTIEDAIDQVATGTVQSSSEGERSLTRITLSELIKAQQHQKAQTASGVNNFGLRMTKLVPPGTG